MTSYTNAIAGIDQRDLSSLGPCGECMTPAHAAWLVLLDDGTVACSQQYLVGGDGTPEPVWHGRWIRWSIQPCTNYALLKDALGEEGALSALLDRVIAGHEVRWNGNNHVGHLTEDAAEASQAIEHYLESIDRVNLCRWRAADWFAPSKEETVQKVREWLSNSETLEGIAGDFVVEAEAHDALLDEDDVRSYLERLLETSD